MIMPLGRTTRLGSGAWKSESLGMLFTICCQSCAWPNESAAKSSTLTRREASLFIAHLLDWLRLGAAVRSRSLQRCGYWAQRFGCNALDVPLGDGVDAVHRAEEF